ncbi:MAG TPA: DUF1565 domain-containing protein [Candidatus Baltobacteraceae bacterium]|nr:DUF1565 domain-containing protein [Candidatus Baltobacteraceae bacterium]
MSGLGRTLFVIFAATAVALVIGSTACTRRGGEGSPPVITPTPITGYYVDPVKGNDANNGSQTSPFKTITRALKAVKASATSGLTISLSPGRYSSGETFPIVIPTGVSLSGSDYGHSFAKASFINGFGEDATLEKAEGKASSRTAFATVVVPPGVSVTFDKVYIGTTNEPNAGTYSSVDVMGSMSGNSSTFGQGLKFAANGGITVAGGTLTCIACDVVGKDFAIKAFTLSSSASSGSGGSPTITLQGPGHSIVGGGDGIRTDGTATVTASAQVFQSRYNAYTDSLVAPTAGPRSTTPSPSPTSSGSSSSSSSSGGGSVDFGYGAQGSLGGNTFVGSTTEINVTLSGAQLFARGNTWNVIPRGPQRTNPSGQYPRAIVFKPGADGQNVKIAGSAGGSTVNVGPAKPPTPTPSPYASGSPSASPSTSPTSSPT